MQAEEIETVAEKEDCEKGHGQLHDAHRGDVIIMGHGTCDLGHAEGIMDEVGFPAADRGIDIFAVYGGVRQKSLLSLVDHRHGEQERHRDAEVGYQDDGKSSPGGLSRGVRSGSGGSGGH